MTFIWETSDQTGEDKKKEMSTPAKDLIDIMAGYAMKSDCSCSVQGGDAQTLPGPDLLKHFLHHSAVALFITPFLSSRTFAVSGTEHLKPSTLLHALPEALGFPCIPAQPQC